MMNKIIILVILSIFFDKEANDSKPIGKVVYDYTASDHFFRYGSSGEATLYFNQQKSFFKSNTLSKRDEIIEEGMNITLKRGDEYGFPILTDFKHKQRVSRIPFSEEKATLHQDLSIIEWNLISDTTKTIEGINCLFAEAYIKTKSYYVWYAPEIPVSAGPNHLWGLPGLILEAHDDLNNENYHVKSIVLSKDIDFTMEMTAKADYIFDSLCAYLTEKKAYRKKVNKEYLSKGEQPIDWEEFDMQSNNVDMIEYDENCK